jgi:HSP20 family protein
MSIVRWNPTNDLLPTFPSDMLNIQREINRMFDSLFEGGMQDSTDLPTSSWSPSLDIAENDNAYVVKVELPGVNKDDVRITMQENVLTIRGEKKQEKESKGSNFHRTERSYGAFQRSFSLLSSVKSEKIEAAYNDGILTVTLPKAESAKPKQIEVKVN